MVGVTAATSGSARSARSAAKASGAAGTAGGAAAKAAGAANMPNGASRDSSCKASKDGMLEKSSVGIRWGNPLAMFRSMGGPLRSTTFRLRARWRP